MAFCPNCGKETTQGAIYCSNCGRSLQGAPQPQFYAQQSYYYPRKEPALAAILSLLIAGVGQMYVGRIVRGIVILIAPTLFAIFIVLPALFFGTFIVTVSPFTRSAPGFQPIGFSAFFFWIIVLILLGLGYHIWNIFDAYNLANVYNERLMTTGRPPW